MKELFATGLVLVSVITSLMTEAIKKLLDEQGKEYKPNVLAVIISICISILTVVGYVLYMGIAFTVQVAVIVVVLIILSFLCATVGYDKVIQTISQIKG